MNSSKKSLIVILGPTAIGKTKLSIELAKKFNTEIISADSRQFYKEMNIGTAKPSKEELESAKHHFIGNLSVSDNYNVSMFEQQALLCLNKIFYKNKYAIMVGGSGLYINALCHGIDELPDPDESLREQLKNLYKTKGIEALKTKLQKLDPEYYAIVDKANPKRLMRGIEVCITSGKKYSSLRSQGYKNRYFNIIKIGLTIKREELFEKINKRVDIMIDSGLLDEAKNLYHYKNLNALNTVGYKELFEYFDKKTSLERAIENIKTNTRRYAKRQMTWFKKDKDIKWFNPENIQEIIEYIKNF